MQGTQHHTTITVRLSRKRMAYMHIYGINYSNNVHITAVVVMFLCQSTHHREHCIQSLEVIR